MVSALSVSAIGAFQGSLSVLLTISYGAIVAKLGIIRPTTVKDISTLCANVFLPALFIANIGKNISIGNVSGYAPIFLWSIIYTLVSMGMGKLAVRWWGLPSWTVAAVTFNNTTSLPLLLTKSFASTGILTPIAGGDPSGAVERATSYFLVNSLVAKTATFILGPHLFGNDCFDSSLSPVPLMISVEPSEASLLLPKVQPISSANSPPASFTARRVLLLFTPTTWGAIFALIIGLTPSLHRTFFAPPQEGGYLSAWVSESLRNVGDVFTVLQIFIVGANISQSFQMDATGESPNPPKKALIAIFAIRFVFWSLISLPLVYYLAAETNVLPKDPIIWWCLILIPIGPPAMILSTLLEVIGVGQRGKFMVARTLAFMYCITPIISLVVVGALKVCEIALEKKGRDVM
ncbi:hypothetical protein P691DRAFT_672431 [Macrolepiota fuliginosa MF-IS2]|uniref:Auxin efflux carrier n=1 Tax=Macrolepiota fuliginosa MF-IS2 TaxID=1400762 RepID=A0A9P6C357_9AGAR|nr:hypothetical protein P691DRAFT_672431 [Macrolepiota fuliginosa MF-IS2]